MRSDQRQFQIFDIEIAARKAGAAIPSMGVAIAIWEKSRAEKRIFWSDSGDRALIIGDLKVDANLEYAALLIRVSDKKFPNSVYSDIVGDTFNEHVKGDHTGADFGCHIIISTKQESHLPNVYTCVIEKVTGISSGLIRRLLSKMLHIEYQENQAFYSYPAAGGGYDKAGNPRMERCCPHIELRGRPSDQFVKEIENGKLTGLTLIKTEPVTPISGAGYLLKQRTELLLHIDHQNLPAALWSALRKTFSANSAAYDAAKLSYRLPNSRRTVTVEIDTRSGTPLSDLYIMTFDLINIFPPLAQSAKKIVPHLIDKAIPEFLANRSV